MITYTIGESHTDYRAGRASAASSEGLFSRLWISAYRAYTRVNSRRQMRFLPDELLKDVGLSRADVEREASKPFWR